VLTLSCGYRTRTDTRGFVYASGKKEGKLLLLLLPHKEINSPFSK
jgi:hypothetical protein